MQLRDIFFGKLIDNGNGTCRVEGISTGAGGRPSYDGVPSPNIAGTGSSGLHISHGDNTTVLCAAVDSVANTGDAGVVILCVIPEQTMYLANQNKLPSDAPLDLAEYEVLDPMDSGTPDIVLAGPLGSGVSLDPSGSIHIATNSGSGVHVNVGKEMTCTHVVSELKKVSTDSMISVSGKVMRDRDKMSTPTSSPNENILMHEYEIDPKRVVGVFNGMNTWDLSEKHAGWMTRNPALAETVKIYCEYAVTSRFSGSDDEPGRMSGDIGYSNPNDTNLDDRRVGNILYMNENRACVSVNGNLICPNGYQLDINLRPIRLGGDKDKYPSGGKPNSVKWADIGRRTRRGVASCFQVATNTFSSDLNNSQGSFLSLIDKEGVVKVNFPKTSATGNILYASNTDYVSASSSPITEFKNPSKLEPIPVTLRGEDGSQILPNKVGDPSGKDKFGDRRTGMMFYNGKDKNRYFPSDKSAVRVNLTAYHDMSSTAERLISNITTKITTLFNHSSSVTANPIGVSEFLRSKGKPWQWADIKKEGYSLPECMGYGIVTPKKPAINPGGNKSVYCGRDESDYKTYTNSFSAEQNSDGEVSLPKEGEYGKILASAGGFSANLNFEGALITSIGGSDHERISLILDTAGSIVTRLGRDKNNRSLILDTDGDVYIDVGGAYDGTYDNGSKTETGLTHNPGRFELRVRTSDLGFVGKHCSQEPPEGVTPDRYLEGDFIISISKAGFAISGGSTGIPMIIRNEGPVEITSSDVLTIGGVNGTKVIQTDGRTVELGKPVSH